MLVRVAVRRISDDRLVGSPAVAAFNMRDPIPASRLGEAAADACRMLASGVGPAAVLARARVVVRDAARRPEVSRTASVVAAVLRRGADAVERRVAEAASQLVSVPPSSAVSEDPID